jgi:uncharacterized protein YqgV (UPF0045/DUF77 family)
MKASIEISLYPLDDDYKPPIKAFIKRLKNYDNLKVVPNGMSTQVFGDYDELMTILMKEVKEEFTEEQASMFVFKLAKGDLSEAPEL